MNAQSPFTVKDATVYRSLEAAPRAFAEWPEAIRAKLLSGELFIKRAEDLWDAPYHVGPLIPDYKLGVDYAICRHAIGAPTFRVYLDTPLCQGCEEPVLAGPCDCEVG